MALTPVPSSIYHRLSTWGRSRKFHRHSSFGTIKCQPGKARLLGGFPRTNPGARSLPTLGSRSLNRGPLHHFWSMMIPCVGTSTSSLLKMIPFSVNSPSSFQLMMKLQCLFSSFMPTTTPQILEALFPWLCSCRVRPTGVICLHGGQPRCTAVPTQPECILVMILNHACIHSLLF